MKIAIIILATCVTLINAANAQQIRYTFSGIVSNIVQTDLDPLWLWDSTLFVGAPVSLTFVIEMDLVDQVDSPSISWFAPTVAQLSVGNYTFSSDTASFGLRDDVTINWGLADGFGFSFTSSEEYFSSTFSIGGSIYTSDTTFLDSVALSEIPWRSILMDVNSSILVNSSDEQFRFEITEVSSVIIPEPASVGVFGGFLVLLYASRKRLTLTGAARGEERTFDCTHGCTERSDIPPPFGRLRVSTGS